MKTLLGIALAAAVITALVHTKRRSGVEPIADSNLVSSGDPEWDQSGPQPQDWRGAQNVLGS
jgi:hypothetical protein